MNDFIDLQCNETKEVIDSHVADELRQLISDKGGINNCIAYMRAYNDEAFKAELLPLGIHKNDPWYWVNVIATTIGK